MSPEKELPELIHEQGLIPQAPDYEEDLIAPEEEGTQEAIEAIGEVAVEESIEPEEKTAAQKLKAGRVHDKMLSFNFEAGDKKYMKEWRVKQFSGLADDVKYLFAVGQVNTPAYDCFNTEEARENWLLRMVNKGKEDKDQLEQEDLSKIAEECYEKGYVSKEEQGAQLTEAGFDYIADFKTRFKAEV